MPRYIDIDALGIGKCNPDIFEDKGYAKGWNTAVELIQSMPVIEVEPVIICQECKYNDNTEDGYNYRPGLLCHCKKHGFVTNLDFFCGDAKKK